MQQEDDLKALENIVQFARGLGVFFFGAARVLVLL